MGKGIGSKQLAFSVCDSYSINWLHLKSILPETRYSLCGTVGPTHLKAVLVKRHMK